MSSFAARVSALAAVLALATFAPSAEASAFLGRELPEINLGASNLLEELERVMGRSHRAETEVRAARLEDAIRPTFLSLPRTRDGLLPPAAVRYLLHRLFVDRHGWFVRGFENAGEAWNTSSPVEALKHAGEEAQVIFEGRLGAGLTLHEAAVLAATLESLVHVETVQRLHDAYRVNGLSSVEDHPHEDQVVLAIDTYMAMYVLGVNHTSATPQDIANTWKVIDKAYPTWSETKKWIREVRKEVVASSPESRTSFATTTRVLEEIAERYGRWQDKECVQIKDSLTALEQAGTGRVPLDTFYGAALNGSWQFSESKSYLRQLGALDESNAARASVVIPNYVNSPSNCVASSKFYSVCCINECEALLGHLERQIAAPDAPVRRIVQVIEKLPSATVEAPRTLPASLVQRLEEIASTHGGRVPFHGRLFAQWLHHAYPRECPYPHLSGTSKPVTPEKWMEMTGEEAVADEETMRWHIGEARKESARSAPPAAEQELPWSEEEELFVSKHHAADAQAATARSASAFHGLALVGVAGSMSVVLMRLVTTARDAVLDTPVQKYAV